MVPSHPSTEPQYPIRVVADRTGLSTDVLRAWERRYGSVTPQRSESGQRLYSESDVVRLRLLVEATRLGHPVARVATLPLSDLTALVERDGPRARATPVLTHEFGERAYAAVREMAPDRLQSVLRAALLSIGATAFLEDLVAPLLHRIGADWHAGALSIAHEHAATAVIRGMLGWLVDSMGSNAGAPCIVIACLAHERHELGAMLAAAVAAHAGWRVVFLGADLPGDQVLSAAAHHDATVVAVSVVHAVDPGAARSAIGSIREGLPPRTALVVGGEGAGALGPIEGDVLHATTLASLRLLLATRRPAPAE